MKLETIQYKTGSGWSAKEFPKLDSKNTVIFLFGSPDLIANDKVFAEIQAAYPLANKIGCSSSGEIFGSSVFDNSLSVGIAQFSKTETRVISSPIKDVSESFKVGEKLAKSLSAKDLKAIFILSDGLRVNGSELIRGVNSVVSEGIIVTGGLAGDGSRFKETWVIGDGVPKSGIITALGLYGENIKIGHASQGGWDIFGPERTITKSESNVLFELDGKPALQLYKEYLGEKSTGLPATGLLFPLQIRQNKEDTIRLVRTILAVDEAKQSMTFAGDIPKGYLAQLMRANFDRLIDGASHAAKEISLAQMKKGNNVLSIAISCVGRRLVLGERTEEEIESVLENMPDSAKLIGFYSYGEISPFVKGQTCELHNQTMTLTTIYEDDTA